MKIQLKPHEKILKTYIPLFIIVYCCFYYFLFLGIFSYIDEADYQNLRTNTYDAKIENDSVFGIVTYNIGYLSGMTNNRSIEKPKELFDNNLQKVLTETKKVNADIIAFQEIDYNADRSYKVNQQNEIAKLGYNYVAETVNWDETDITTSNQTPKQNIFSKLKKTENNIITPSPNISSYAEEFRQLTTKIDAIYEMLQKLLIQQDQTNKNLEI